MYWECTEVKRIWDLVRTFCNMYLEEYLFAKIECLLSDYDVDVIVLISIIVKHQFFICKLNNWPLKYLDVLDNIEREGNTHLSRIKSTQMKNYYNFWGALAFGSCFESEHAIWADQ